MVIGESVAITVVVTGRVTEAVAVVLWSFQISRDTRIRNSELTSTSKVSTEVMVVEELKVVATLGTSKVEKSPGVAPAMAVYYFSNS